MRVGSLSIPDHLLEINPHLLKRTKTKKAPRASDPPSVSVIVHGSEYVVIANGLKLTSELNARENVGDRIRRVRSERELIQRALAGHVPPESPVVVGVVRVGRQRMDRDNLAGAAKHLVDGVAAWCGIDDGDEARFASYTDQETGAASPAVYLYIGPPEAPSAAPWRITAHARQRWTERVAAGCTWEASMVSLASIASTAQAHATRRDGRREYVHPSHPNARFVVTRDLTSDALKLVTVDVVGAARRRGP